MNRRIVVALAALVAGLALASPLVRSAAAQSPAKPRTPASPTGVWRGVSVCLVRPSPCNDEIVVYRITSTKTTDSLTLDARKIVRGVEEEMGILGCRFAPSSGRLTCPMPRGTWRFTVRNDSLTGELRLLDDTRFRDVRTARAP